MNTDTPDGGGLGFLLKLLLPAEYRVNGFIFDSPMTTFLSSSHKPSHCCCSRSTSLLLWNGWAAFFMYLVVNRFLVRQAR